MDDTVKFVITSLTDFSRLKISSRMIPESVYNIPAVCSLEDLKMLITLMPPSPILIDIAHWANRLDNVWVLILANQPLPIGWMNTVVTCCDMDLILHGLSLGLKPDEKNASDLLDQIILDVDGQINSIRAIGIFGSMPFANIMRQYLFLGWEGLVGRIC